MNLWAVIPSKDRPEMLANLVTSLVNDNVNVVVIDTGYDPPWETYHGRVDVLRDTDEPLNISRWWNRGIDHVKAVEGSREHVVAVLNDDLVIPRGFVQRLAEVIVMTGGAAAYPDQHDCFQGSLKTRTHFETDPINIFTRLCGYAFALCGSAGLRADETLQWWYGDDDLDWQARRAGGSVLVGGLKVEHLSPNSTTVGKLAEQAGRDRQTFMNKWSGRAPW